MAILRKINRFLLFCGMIWLAGTLSAGRAAKAVIEAPMLSPFSQAVSCASYVEQQKLISPEGLSNVNFGDAIAISGNTAVIGAPLDNVGMNNRQGSAYVFVRGGTTWSFQQKLTAPDGAFDDRFGVAVAISGDTILAGANLDDVGASANQGSAYVFVRNGAVWSLNQKLVATNGAFGDLFGGSVALSGDTALIGAGGDNLGRGYVFARSGGTWSQQQQLTPPPGESAGGFAAAVAIHGETTLIGSPGATVGISSGQGAAYVFVRGGGTWSFQQRLTAADGEANDRFGFSVAIQGDTAVIGTPDDAVGSNQSQGSAYVFSRGGTAWNQQQKLVASDGETADGFGRSVGVNGDTVVVTSPGDDIPPLGQGSAYVFTRAGSNWTLLQQLITSEGGGGTSLAFDGDSVAIGNISDNINRGAGFVFACSSCPPITLGPPTLPNGRIGNTYNQSLTVTGGVAPYTFSQVTGSLPAGVTLTPAGVLSGLPAETGYFIFSVRATDNNGCAGRKIYAFSIFPPCGTISFTPNTLPLGFVGAPYTEILSIGGGMGNYTVVVQSGSLPPGIALLSAGVSAILSGTPTATGVFNVTLRATDGIECVGSQAFAITINPPCPNIVISPGALPGGTVGVPYSQTLTQTGGAAPVIWSIVGGGPPSGFSFNALTGVLSGTPALAVGYAFTVRVTDANGCFNQQNYELSISNGGLQYYALPRPIRLFDTRAPFPGFPACAYLNSPLVAGQEVARQARITCDGITIPAAAQAITGNATVVAPSGSGFVTLWPNGQPRPPVSNLNYVAGQVVPNAFTVGLDNDGMFRIYSLAGTHFIVDVTGYFAPPGAGGMYYHPLARPIRLFDTRAPFPGFPACAYLNAPLIADAELTRPARISCDGATIPADAQAIVGNATVASPAANGFVTLWPNGQPRPPVSNLNYLAGQVVPNAFTVGLGSDGQFNIYSLAGTHFIVDVTGYYSASPTSADGNSGLFYTPLQRPIRLFDTRAPFPGFPACEYLNSPLVADAELAKAAPITCDGVTIPPGVQAIAGNATVVSPAANGFVTLWPNGQPRPPVSNLNYVTGQVVPNAFTVRVGGGGLFRIYSYAGTHFITDVTGYYAP